MIQVQTHLHVADNSGAKKVQCIKVLGGSKKKEACLGDMIVVAVKEALPRKKVKKGDVRKGIIVRTKKQVVKYDSSRISFSQNALLFINEQENPIGTRILGPITVSRELKKKKWTKILSLASYIL
uniref:Ribosomal protein L14 n=1 Tax=Moramonas marocensis TaxID=1805496 RepID=A0A140F2G4_9EUKA|nr:ribosomal protein L14 [Moramonas marocensis]